MRNIGLLLKNYFLCAIGSMRNKKSRLKSSVGIFVIVAIYVAFFALMLLSQIAQMDVYAQAGMENVVLGMGFFMSAFLAIIFALQKITGGQKSNDVEILLSMPFRKSEIMIAKAGSRYLFNLALVSLFALPSVIAYLAFTPFSILAFFGSVLTLLSIPLFAVGLSFLVDSFIISCLPNTKFGNVFKAIFTILVLVGVIGIYEFVNFNTEIVARSKIIELIVSFNPVFMLPFLAVCLLIFILGNYLEARLLNRETSSPAKNNQIKIKNRITTPFRALLKNETNRYLNSTALMVNTLIGPLGVIAVTVWLLIDRGHYIGQLCIMLGLSLELVPCLIAIIYGFFTIMTYLSAISISLEGKQFWILRSMPLNPNLVLSAKAIFNILLLAPILLLSGVIIAIALGFNVLYFVNIVLFPLFLSIAVSYFGVLVNLLFPKFEYESDAVVIKQSFSALIMMLTGIVTEILICLLYYGLYRLSLAIVWVYLIPLILVGAVMIVGVTMTYTLGKRIFNRL